jgi:quercetin dioxygenase-like cupin family protein
LRAKIKVTKWPDLTVFRFTEAIMRPLVTLDETSALACYHIKLSKRKFMRPVFHKKAVEVIWILRGKGIAHLEDRRLKISAKDVIFIAPPAIHGFSTQDSSLEMLAILSPRVDSQTDFYSVDKSGHGRPRVLAGRWEEKSRS